MLKSIQSSIFIFGMAIGAAYLSLYSYYIHLSRKFMLLFTQLFYIKQEFSKECHEHFDVVLLLDKGGLLWQETESTKVMCLAC